MQQASISVTSTTGSETSRLQSNLAQQGRIVLFGGPITNTNIIFFLILNTIITYVIFHDAKNAHNFPWSYSMLVFRLVLNVVIFGVLKYLKRHTADVTPRVLKLIYLFQYLQISFLIWICFTIGVLVKESVNDVDIPATVDLLNLIIMFDFISYLIYVVIFSCINRNPYVGIRLMNYVGEFTESATPTETRNLQTCKYNKEGDVAVQGTEKHINFNETYKECPICTDEFETDEDLKILPCAHYYHKNCAIQWFQQKFICPVCRYDLRRNTYSPPTPEQEHLTPGDSSV